MGVDERFVALYEIRADRSRFVIRPARGGIVTQFDVGDDRVMYMDADTLRDATKNVRGGNPVLFPSPGKLADDKWSRDGKAGVVDLVTPEKFREDNFWTRLFCHITGTGGLNGLFLLADNAPDFVQDRGHTYGSKLPDEDKRALIEYLKTF